MKYNDDMENSKKQIQFIFNCVQILFQLKKIKTGEKLREKEIFYLNLNETLQK